MSKRLKLILTRPADDSFEEFVRFRGNAMIRLTSSKPSIIKEDIIKEWGKFWGYINTMPQKKICADNLFN